MNHVHQHREEQKARIQSCYSNANDVIEKAAPKDTDAGKTDTAASSTAAAPAATTENAATE